MPSSPSPDSSTRRTSAHNASLLSRTSAGAFTTFYEECPVLKAPTGVRESRLALCALVLRVLLAGLGLLGIPVPERM